MDEEGGWLHRLAAALALAGMGVVALVGLYTVGDVVMRYVFNAPLPGAVDVVTYGLALAVGAVMPWGVVARSHVAVTILADRAGPRGRALLDAFVLTVVAGFFVLLAWRIGLYALERLGAGDTMWILAWPVWPVWGLVALGLAGAAVTAVLVAALGWRAAARA